MQDPRNYGWRQVTIFVFAFLLKFGPGTAVSVLLSEAPVWLKGQSQASHLLSSALT